MYLIELFQNYKKRIINIIILISILVIAFLAYLIIRDLTYLNKVNFSLNGSNNVTLFLNQPYVEDGYSATYKGQNISNKVIINNELNNAVSGSYNISYIVKKGIFSKTLDRAIFVRLEDYNDLSISLKGNARIYLLNGKPYIEEGVIATDRTAGDMSKRVTTIGNVNNKVNGEYKLTYQVVNSFGVLKTVERVVIVYNLNYTLELETTNIVKDSVNIKFYTDDSKYNYTLLPNGEKTTLKSFKYSAEKNDIYTFTIYDINSSAIVKEIEVKNIISDPPTGVCNGILYDKSTVLNVQVNEEANVAYYIYHYGSNTYKQNKNSFTYKEMINEASVDIYDKFDRKTTANCIMKDSSTIVPSGYTSTSYYIESLKKTIRYWIYIPKNTHVRTKIPLMIYLHGDGSKGTNMNLVNNYAFPKFASEGQEYPFIMIAPQCALDANWTGIPERVKALIDYIISNYNIDTERIIMSGGSSGGRGAYNMVATYPNFFSCLVVGSGRIEVKYASKLTGIPIWAFHGAKDTAVPYSSAKNLIDAINNLGGNAKLTTIDGGHEITETVFKYPELIDWMIKQKR